MYFSCDTIVLWVGGARWDAAISDTKGKHSPPPPCHEILFLRKSENTTFHLFRISSDVVLRQNYFIFWKKTQNLQIIFIFILILSSHHHHPNAVDQSQAPSKSWQSLMDVITARLDELGYNLITLMTFPVQIKSHFFCFCFNLQLTRGAAPSTLLHI